MANTYSNFHDPLGLVMRMLRSRDRAAWSALRRAALSFLLLPLDLAWEALEQKRLREAEPSNLPIILIVGAPRSGTTLLYQTLARFLPVSYLQNFTALFPRSPLIASAKLGPRLQTRAADYHSYYGNTAGWTAPNDGFHVWNRWLGTDRYRVAQQLSPAAQQDMQRFFNAWLSSFQKPLLNKNNRNTACVALLASALRNVYFIEARREPAFVVQSLLQAREHIQGSKAIGWGLASAPQTRGAQNLDYVSEVCEQVFRIEQRLQSDKQRVAPERFLSIAYEDFCREPCQTARHVAQTFLRLDLDENKMRRELKPFHTTNKIRLAREEFQAIRRRLDELYEKPAAPALGNEAYAEASRYDEAMT